MQVEVVRADGDMLHRRLEDSSIDAKQAKKFAASFYTAVARYCLENQDEFKRWENELKNKEGGDQIEGETA